MPSTLGIRTTDYLSLLVSPCRQVLMKGVIPSSLTHPGASWSSSEGLEVCVPKPLSRAQTKKNWTEMFKSPNLQWEITVPEMTVICRKPGLSLKRSIRQPKGTEHLSQSEAPGATVHRGSSYFLEIWPFMEWPQLDRQVWRSRSPRGARLRLYWLLLDEAQAFWYPVFLEIRNHHWSVNKRTHYIGTLEKVLSIMASGNSWDPPSF